MASLTAKSRTATAALGCLITSDAVVLGVLRPDLAALGRHLAAPRAWLSDVGADRVVAELAGAALWCAAVWLAFGLLAAAVASVPGRVGLLAARVARVTLPAAVHRVVAGSAGLGVFLAPLVGVSGVAAAQSQSPDGSGGRPVAASTSLPTRSARLPAPDWPLGESSASRPSAPAWPGQGSAPRDASPGPAATPSPTSIPTSGPTSTSLPAPTPHSTSAPTSPAARPDPIASGQTPPHGGSRRDTPAARSERDRTTVRAGDCLWMIAAHRLASEGATTTATADTAVAAYVPQLYDANRRAIGDDADLVRPGQVLVLPTPSTEQESPS